MKFQSFVPLELWGDSILTTTYLINRLPSKHLGNKTPYEMLFKQPPSYKHLKTFGCLCYISTLSHNRHKFAPRAKRCVFLGYPTGIKGYKFLDLDTRIIFVSRDIVFYESIFPFAALQSCVNSDSSSTVFLDDFVVPHCVHATFPDSIPSLSVPLQDHIELLLVSRGVCDSADTHDSADTQGSADLTHTANTPFVEKSCAPQPSHAHDTPILPVISEMDTTPLVVARTSSPLDIKKSTRPHKQPSYLQHYSCKVVGSKPLPGQPYDIFACLTYSNLSKSYQQFFMAIDSNSLDPTSFLEAVQSLEWRAAMDKEIQVLELTNTWTLTTLPPSKVPIGWKWVYRTKYKSDGTIERHKARLVAKGHT